MAPLVILLVVFGLASAALRVLRGEWLPGPSGRIAAAAMFVFTGISHFLFPAPMAEMVPPVFPAPQLWVAATGVVEVVGGIGLLSVRTRPLAAWGLAIFLVAVFPANVYAALERVGMGGHREGPGYLWFRAPLQVFFLAWVVYFGVSEPRRRSTAAIGR